MVGVSKKQVLTHIQPLLIRPHGHDNECWCNDCYVDTFSHQRGRCTTDDDKLSIVTMMILQKGKRRKMTKKVIRAITLMALYILSVACLSTNTLPDLVVTAFPTTTRMTSQNHVSKVMLHRTTKTQSSRLVALNNQVVTMEDAVEVSTSQNEDGIDTISSPRKRNQDTLILPHHPRSIGSSRKGKYNWQL